jgi:hypothetical protein
MHSCAMSRPRVVATIAMLCTGLAYNATAVAAPRLAITVSGECPSRSAVIAAVKEVLPDIEIVEQDRQAPALTVISDTGPGYFVRIAAFAREYGDSPESCEARADKVAILATLELSPPAIARRTPPGALPTIDVASHVRPGSAPRLRPSRLAIQLETGGVFDAAEDAAQHRFTAGVDMRLAIGWRNLQVAIGGTAVGPMMLSWGLSSGSVRIQRYPIDLALRGRLSRDGMAVAVEVGPRFTLQISDGVDVMRSVHAVRLEAGVRIASRLEIWPWRKYGAYAQVQAHHVPRPSRFTMPYYQVGEMPSWWLGASFGVAMQM